jgi:hypothetical protein
MYHILMSGDGRLAATLERAGSSPLNAAIAAIAAVVLVE